jgi:hypothetical protein
MAKQKQQQKQQKKKLGRNDSCWCGSGKKYKECHLPIQEEQKSEQRRLHEAEGLLMAKIMEAAQEVPDQVASAVELYWNGEYTADQMAELDELEEEGSSRFLVWFAFDYVPEGSPTLVERMVAAAERGELELDSYESRLLKQWMGVRLRPYVVEEVEKGFGITARDLLDDGVYVVKDKAATKRLLVGEVMVGHIVPVGVKDAGQPPTWVQQGLDEPPDGGEDEQPIPLFSVAGSMAQLTEDTQEKLVEFAGLYLADLQRTQPDATWTDLLRERSHILNHFVMALPVEEPDPTVIEKMLFDARVALGMMHPSLGGSKDKGDEGDGGGDGDFQG